MSPKLFNILLIIASIVIYSYVINPLYTGADGVFWNPENSIQTLHSQSNEYDATIHGVKGVIIDASSTLGKYNTFDDKIKRDMSIMVPDSVIEMKLLNELTKISTKRGFAIEDLSIKDKSGKYSINFTVKTTYQNFKQFVIDYEKSMRLLTLSSVSFNPVKDELEPVKFTVSFTTYYMK